MKRFISPPAPRHGRVDVSIGDLNHLKSIADRWKAAMNSFKGGMGIKVTHTDCSEEPKFVQIEETHLDDAAIFKNLGGSIVSD